MLFSPDCCKDLASEMAMLVARMANLTDIIFSAGAEQKVLQEELLAAEQRQTKLIEKLDQRSEIEDWGVGIDGLHLFLVLCGALYWCYSRTCKKEKKTEVKDKELLSEASNGSFSCYVNVERDSQTDLPSIFTDSDKSSLIPKKEERRTRSCDFSLFQTGSSSSDAGCYSMEDPVSQSRR
ncbi:MAG: hypothetical protein V4700_01905 [Pseudomonadota bacterium]